MKSFINTLGRLLIQTWLWSLLLVIGLGLLVWFFGPLLAVSEQRFWESATSRLLTICLLLLGWGLLLVMDERRRSKASAPDDLDKKPTQGELNADGQRQLHKRFSAAVKTLQRSSLYSGRSERWRKELPWYLVIGPSGSGKTSLLDHSGIKFPLNRLDDRHLGPPKPTELCDWYFAEQGVLLDTSGGYLSQDRESEKHGWRTLLKLLRSRRRTRPISGVLINIPLDALQDTAVVNLSQLAGQIRSRLKDIHQHLRTRLPVYLVVSKMDRVPGFEAFFSQLSLEESQQVLGISFREDQQGADPGVLHDEFEALLRRLNSQVVLRLHQERNIERRGTMLDFPNQLGMIGTRLKTLVDSAFAGNRYERASQLRGVYLSGAPYWKPAATLEENQTNGEQKISRGAPRFIHHLLSRVIFPEAGLAGLDKRETRRIHWGQRALYGVAFGTLAGFGLLWANSFTDNHQRFDQLRTFGQQFTRQVTELKAADDALAILPELDTTYASTQVFPTPDALALHERNGLYQGKPSNPVLHERYVHELDQQLLPRVARQMEGQIRANLSNRDELLNNLRAYLMLGLPERRDQETLKQWLTADWSRRYLGDPTAQQSLNEHFARLLQQSFRYPLDEALVSQARQALRKVSLADLVYRSLREQARGLAQYRLEQHFGTQGTVISGGHTVIPGLYTQRGYQQYFLPRAASLAHETVRNNWVTGENSNLNPLQLRDVIADLEQLYFRDYAEHWTNALANLTLQPQSSLAQNADQAATLGATNSPLVKLLVQLRDNTRFPTLGESSAELSEAVAEIAAPAGALGTLAKAVAQQANSALASATPGSAKRTLQLQFEPLHRLLDDNDGPSAELAPALAALNDVQQVLSNLSQGSQPDQATFDFAKARMNGQRGALDSLRNTAARLPAPMTGWLRSLADNSWQLALSDSYHYVDRRYRTDLYSVYSAALHKRYPFSAHSSSDVAVADFREFFKAQGIADNFFSSYLKPFVDHDGSNYRLRSVDGRTLPMSRLVLAQLANVQQIRRGFFAENNAEPLIRFSLEPYSLDAGLSRADFQFGGQKLEYRHGPIVPAAFQWPDATNEGLSSLIIEELSGRRTGIQKNTGAWSLFRLFDLMETEPHRGRDVLMLKADVGGMRANYLLLSQRSPNPFDLSAVRSFQLPETL